MEKGLFENLSEVLVEEFSKDSARLSSSTTLEDLELDSLDLINFLFRVEELYSVKIPDTTLVDGTINTLSDLIQYIEKHR